MGKLVIGLTGPTGAGKSTVAAVLKKFGCVIIDADIIARNIVNNKECRDKLKNTFGEVIFGINGLDRKMLSKIAFADKESTKKLNDITHPVILKESKLQIEKAKKSQAAAVVFDAPLLFESGADILCDTTVAVISPPASRLKRIIVRDNISEQLAQERMDAQHGNDYYKSRADYVFDGSTDWGILDEKVGELLRLILKEHA